MRYLPLAKALLTRRVPVYVHYGITHRCNLRCRMCGLWKIGNRHSELGLPQIRQVARNLRRLGTTAISLGGGEPFLRPDLPEIIRAFSDLGIEVRVLTNGLVHDPDLLRRVQETGIRHVSLSLDTPDPARQADICAREGVWEGILQAVRHWAEHLRPRRGLGVLNCVVTRLNHLELPRIVELAEAFGFYASFVPLELHHYRDADLGCREAFHDMPFTAEDHPRLDAAFNELIRMKAQGRRVFNSTPFLEYTLRYLKGQPTGWRCRAGSLSFSLSPEGLYSMCHRFQGTGRFGTEQVSAADPDFVDWFLEEHAAREAERVASKCQSCFRPCWQEVALAFTHPRAFLEAAALRRPGPIPKGLPDPRQLVDPAHRRGPA